MPSGPRVRGNNSFGFITDNPLAIGATTMNSAGLATLPVVASAHAVITLDPLRQFGEPEIVVVTVHTAAATTATITRGAYGTVARAHPQNTVWTHAPVTEDVIPILTSGTRPTDPYNGEILYETDTDSYVGRAADASWRTIVGLGAWTNYTPTVTQGVAVAKTVNGARYARIGRTIITNVNLSITGTGTASTKITVSLPVTGVGTALAVVIGSAWLFDASAGILAKAVVEFDTTTTVAFRPQSTTANDFLGTAVITAALASTDQIQYFAIYEAAS